MSSRQRKPVAPHADYGFFGPESVTWKVWSYPTALTVGFQRAVVVEELDPALVASVDQTRAIRDRPRTRYDRTLRYFALIAFGDSHSAMKAADILVKVHSKAIGIEPLSGNPYDANDPHSQLWIHLTAWHSILYTYERFGPGRLSAEEESQYWEECALAAEFQTCDPADVPRSREGIREYFETMRPKLAGSEVAQATMDHLLDVRVMLPPTHRFLKPAIWAGARMHRAATIATMPQWMRRTAGIRQPKLVDALVAPPMRLAFWLAARDPRVELQLLRQLSPSTVAVVSPILLDIAPERRETITPAEARERYGFDKPAQAHQAWRAKQRARLFDEGQAPSDAGLIESQTYLGAM